MGYTREVQMESSTAEATVGVERAWVVRRVDNGAGLSVRARTAEEAIRKARRYGFMRDTSELTARLFINK